MLKHILLAAAAIACTVPFTQAQNATMATTRTITGMVVDKNGNPLSGAEVRATGGAETVYTEADGSYSIEVPVTLKSLTASYTGLRDRKLKTTSFDRMTFTLTPLRHTHGFVNLVGAGVKVLGGEYKVSDMIPQLGVMGGAYRKWGGYAKIVMGGFGYPRIPCSDCGGSHHFEPTPTVTGGVIKRLSNNVNLLVGIGAGINYNVYGYGNTTTAYNSDNTINTAQSYHDEYYDPETEFTLAGEIAVMYHWRKFNIIAGVTYIAPCLGGDYNDSYSYRDEYNDGSYTISNYWNIDNDNNGNIAVFVSVGLHI